MKLLKTSMIAVSNKEKVHTKAKETRLLDIFDKKLHVNVFVDC